MSGSFDLLADLDSFYQAKPSDSTASRSKQESSHADDFLDFGFSDTAPHGPGGDHFAAALNTSQQVPAGHDDDFGDFEAGDDVEASMKEVQHAPVSKASITPALLGRAVQPLGIDQQYYPRPTPLHVPETNRHKPRSRPPKPAKPANPARDDNVFFDAEEDVDDEYDEYDDPVAAVHPMKIEAPPVRTVTPITQPKRQQQSLLDVDDEPAITASQPVMLDSAVRPSVQDDFEWSAYETPSVPIITEMAHNNMVPAKPSPPVLQANKSSMVNKPSVPEVDQGWDEFEVAVPATTHPQNTVDQSITKSSTSELPIQLPTMLQEAHTRSSTPPTNIPPPALLIPLFTQSITLAQTQLFSHLASPTHTAATRTAILSHPTTHTFLKSYLALATVLARIVAGRKLRWKRDTILSQSMRIGAASASGKSGGMKLTGVDKGENAREEREVADVLRLWRAQLGKLRSAVTGTGNASLPSIPELIEAPMVRVAKEVDGGVPAPKQCIVCALKRNERVAKVDFDVEDVFGEWWIEHFGHKSCVAFWFANEGRLRSR